MNIYDILGPIMVGPSSSHTAGAVRIGRIAQKLLGETPQKAEITLHGSFAATGAGHGTDKALLAGLLGMEPDDIRIPESDVLARAHHMEYSFHTKNIRGAHPNTALLVLTGRGGKKLKVQASSLGGGRILVNYIDDIRVDFSGEQPTLIVHNHDEPGHVAEVSAVLYQAGINIATMALNRSSRGGRAVLVTETDTDIPSSVVEHLRACPGILKVTCINLGGKSDGI